jgi:sugar transferase (PEP-CTERM/EpsH1 system associated)
MTGARAAMDSLLFLCHRLPYPPNKGDKVRSYHFLKHLAGRYRIFLGTFVDDPADWKHVEALRGLCADVHVERLSPRTRRLGSAAGFLTGEALTLPYFRSGRLRTWVQAVTGREGIERAFAYSSPMAQYLVDVPHVRRFIDFVDLDSAKWAAYARTRRWPISALYAREARHLLCFEKDAARRAEAVIFVTEEEAQLFRNEAPESADHVMTIRNGVDGEYYSPAHGFESPFASDEHAIVFTGAMDYWPNVDAVVWFARDVLPEIRRRDPAARFYVVGMNPDAAVRALGNNPATVVTGRVSDVRPYLKHARVVVAPLRVARGIQNKVLEAMAMAKPTVATPAAAGALSALPGTDFEVAADAHAFAEKVLESMDLVRAKRMGMSARSRVLADYAWPASLKLLEELLERDGAIAGAAVPAPTDDLGHAICAKVIA